MTLYNGPQTAFVAGFIGSPKMNLFEGAIAKAEGCRIYGVRPEHLSLSPTDGKWRGTVRHIERLGADSIVHLDVETLGSLLVRTDGDKAITIGDAAFASPMPSKEHRFS
jgi:multiple sugar transport system ATP-binding protein